MSATRVEVNRYQDQGAKAVPLIVIEGEGGPLNAETQGNGLIHARLRGACREILLKENLKEEDRPFRRRRILRIIGDRIIYEPPVFKNKI